MQVKLAQKKKDCQIDAQGKDLIISIEIHFN